MIRKQAGERARNLAQNSSCESRMRPERGIGLRAESATSVELVVGINSEGHAELEVVRDSEASSRKHVQNSVLNASRGGAVGVGFRTSARNQTWYGIRGSR